MKKIILFLFVSLLCVQTASAQTKLSKAERRQIEKQRIIDEINGIIESKEFLFDVTQMYSGAAQNNNTGLDMPTTGLSGYFFEVKDGKLDVYMPYAGQAHVPTLNDSGIELNTTSFTIITTPKKEASEGWLIEVRATDKINTSYIFLFDILQNGDTMLMATISSKDRIRYKGNLSAIEKKNDNQ